jgi:hypothetical protein
MNNRFCDRLLLGPQCIMFFFTLRVEDHSIEAQNLSFRTSRRRFDLRSRFLLSAWAPTSVSCRWVRLRNRYRVSRGSEGPDTLGERKKKRKYGGNKKEHLRTIKQQRRTDKSFCEKDAMDRGGESRKEKRGTMLQVQLLSVAR